MIVRELLTKLGFSVDGTGMRDYENRIDRVKRSAQGAADAVRGMVAGFIGFSALQSLSKTADTMQSLEARMGMLTQTVTSNGEAFDAVAARATAARAGLEPYMKLYQKLGDSGKEYLKTQEDVLKVTDTFSKALAVGGATATEQASAILQFGQAMGSGVLSGEEFRALAEASPVFMNKFAEAIGIPRNELKKFAEDQKITTEVMIGALQKMGPEFNALFDQLPMSIGTATTIIGNRWAVFVNRMNRESHAVKFIADIFLGTFDLIEKGLTKMVDFFGGATQTVKFFGTALMAALAPLVFKGAVGAIALLLSPIGLLITALTVVGLAAEDFYQWMNGGVSVFGHFFGSFEQYRPAFVAGLDAIKGIFEVVMRVGGAFFGALSSWLAGGPSEFDAFFAPFSVYSARFMEAMRNIGAVVTFVAGELSKAFAWVRQSFTESMENGLLAQLQTFIAIAVPILQSITKYFFDLIPFRAIYDGVTALFSQLVAALTGALNTVAGIIKTIYGVFTLDGQTAVAGLKQTFGGLHDFFTGIAKSILAAMRLIFSGIGSFFGDQIDRVKGKWNNFQSWIASKNPFKGPGNTSLGVPAIPALPSRVGMGTAAGAASSPAGVPTGGSTTANTVTLNQQFQAGTPEGIVKSAGKASKAGVQAGMAGVSRQAAQVGF